MTAAPAERQRYADRQYHRDGDHPGRKHEVHHDADGHDGNDPHQSVPHGEAALHA